MIALLQGIYACDKLQLNIPINEVYTIAIDVLKDIDDEENRRHNQVFQYIHIIYIMYYIFFYIQCKRYAIKILYNYIL